MMRARGIRCNRHGAAAVAAAACAGAAAACVIGLGGGTAEATTANNSGLPVPKVGLSTRIGSAFEGRFFLTRTPRESKFEGAALDIADDEASEPTFYFGEMTLVSAQGGDTENVLLDLWWFFYHKRQNRLTARLIPPGSVSSEHPEGVQAGTISFAVPGAKKNGLANGGRELKELKDAEVMLNGKGPYRVSFGRYAAVSRGIPRAKLYGK